MIRVDRLVGTGAATAFTAATCFLRPPVAFLARSMLSRSSHAGDPAGDRLLRFATELGECALEALALVVELGKALRDQVTRLVEYVAGAGHSWFLSFHQFASQYRSVRSVAQSL